MESRIKFGFKAGGSFTVRVYSVCEGKDSTGTFKNCYGVWRAAWTGISICRPRCCTAMFWDGLNLGQRRPAHAGDAGMVIVALAPEGRLSVELVAWWGEWAERRTVRDAALAVFVAARVRSLCLSPKFCVARRNGMA